MAEVAAEPILTTDGQNVDRTVEMPEYIIISKRSTEDSVQ